MPRTAQHRSCLVICLCAIATLAIGLVADALAQNTIWFCVDHSASGLGTGHGYVELWPANDNTKAVGRGFYSKQKPLAFGGGISFAKVKDDLGSPWEYCLKFDVTAAEYNAVARRINFTKNGAFQYSLLTHDEAEQTMNCVGWLEYLAKAIYQNGAAFTTLPATTNKAGVRDPNAFYSSLNAIGAGGTWTTVGAGARALVGKVVKNPNRAVLESTTGLLAVTEPIPPDSTAYTCFDMGDSLAQYQAHNTPTLLADHMEIPSIDAGLGSFTVNLSDSFVVQVIGVDADLNIVSMDWGDGSSYSEKQTRMAHQYSALGHYVGSLAEVDSGAVRRYPLDVTVVSTGPSDALGITVSALPAGTALNPCANADSAVVLGVDRIRGTGELRVEVERNPMFGSEIRLRIWLAGRPGGRVDLVDLAGRRILQRDMPGWGTEPHVMSLHQALAPGVYFVRLSDGVASSVARVVALE